MEILQIRKETFVSTNNVTGVKEVILNTTKSHLENFIEFDFGTQRLRIQITFEKSVDGWAKIRKLYNEVLVSLIDRLTSKYALIVNVGSSNMVESWQWLGTNQRDQLVIPVDKKYKVGISCGFDVELEVTAANEEEAYKKAKDGINKREYADEINYAVEFSQEIKHFVNEIQ